MAATAACGAAFLPSAAGADSPYFVGDPNATGNLLPWQYFDSGGTYEVSQYPNGTHSPGVVAVADDPLGQRGKVYQETVTATSRWSGGASRGDWTFLYNDQSASYFGENGETDWLHFGVMFPGGGAYHNTPGEWNVLLEAHNNSDYFAWSTACEDAELEMTVVQYSGDSYPYLAMRILGGDDGCPVSNGTWIYDDSDPLQYNHWYDVLLHVVWSPDSSAGLVEWWLDGRLLYSSHIADLWRRPDGSVDQTELELNNYRLHELYPSTVYYSKALVGPTEASVDASSASAPPSRPCRSLLQIFCTRTSPLTTGVTIVSPTMKRVAFRGARRHRAHHRHHRR